MSLLGDENSRHLVFLFFNISHRTQAICQPLHSIVSIPVLGTEETYLPITFFRGIDSIGSLQIQLEVLLLL